MNKIADGLGSKFGRLIYSLVAFIAGYVLGFFFLWKMTLVMLAALPVIAISAGLLAKVLYCNKFFTVTSVTIRLKLEIVSFPSVHFPNLAKFTKKCIACKILLRLNKPSSPVDNLCVL